MTMFDDDWWYPRFNEAYDPEYLLEPIGLATPEPEEEDYCVECAGSGWDIWEHGTVSLTVTAQTEDLFQPPKHLDPCPSCKGSGEP